MGEHHAVLGITRSFPDIAGWDRESNGDDVVVSDDADSLEELEARRLQTAVRGFTRRSALPADVGGKASTVEFTDGVIAAMA
jgi:hypothetical protein